MLKSYTKISILIAVFIFSCTHLFASHINGSWLTYTHLSGDTFHFEINMIRDCSGIGLPSSETLVAVGCGTIVYGTATLQSTFQIPIGFPLAQSSCNGGALPGFSIYTYGGNLVMPSGCDSVQFNIGSCCFSASINYSSQGYTISSPKYVHDNSSVQFSMPYHYTFEADTTKTYTVGLGTHDLDGDSLVFELTNPMSSAGVPMTPNLPYTSANPFPWITLDSITGQMEITPPGLMGSYMAFMRVHEYALDGTYKGSVDKTFTFMFISSTNSMDVEPSLTNVSNVTGGTYANNIFTTTTGGTNICFDLTFSDTNALDTIYFTSNITDALPGAIVNYTGINPITASICWNYSLASGTHHHFKTSLRDVCDTCSTFSGFQEYEFLIKLWGTLPSVPNSATICQGDSFQINAGSADSISWTVWSGDPMVVGTNFSCDDCSTPIASPTSTTSYIMWGQTQGFISIDTITIFVSSPMTNSGLPSNSSICEGDTLWLNANTGYGNISWLNYMGDTINIGQNMECLDCDSNWFSPSNNSSIIFAKNLGGLCEFMDTINVNVLHLPNNLISASSFNLCQSDSANIAISSTGSYQWNSVSGSPVITGTNISCDTCDVVWISPDSNSVWTITNTLLPGCVATDTISVNHYYLNPSGLPSAISICEGDSIIISSNSNGYHSWSYSNSIALIGINISNTLGNPVTIYPSINDTLIAHNNVGVGCYQIDSITITIQSLQTDLGLPNGATICQGDSILLNTTANANIQWTSLMGSAITVGTNFNCDTCAIAIAWPNQNTIYQVTNTYFTGCFEKDTIAISVNDSALIYGTIIGQAPNLANLFPLENSEVNLYSFATSTSTWVLEANTITDSNGYYYFYSPSDSVMVSVIPDTTQYGVQPAYFYGNSFNQTQGNVITTTACGYDEASLIYPFSINVGVTDVKKIFSKVFPNPNTGKFNIFSNHQGQYSIFSTTGILVKKGVLNAGNNSIKLNNADGLYYIHTFIKGQIHTIKIVVE